MRSINVKKILLWATITVTQFMGILTDASKVTQGAMNEMSGAQTSKEIIYWEEIIPQERSDEKSSEAKRISGEKRKVLWKKEDQVNMDPIQMMLQSKQPKKKNDEVTPHPMRTDEWKLQIKCRGKNKDLFKGIDTLEFARNGYVRVVPCDEGDNNRLCKPAVGKWEVLPNGIAWTIPIQIRGDDACTDSGKETVLNYFADLHLNQFGGCPKMMRGVITRDRFPNSRLPKQWFRPVLARFAGEGIGEDTADVSYQHRGIGLSSN
mmetsp:Transcript_9664/g.13669  ORF Transcript_9664/g.13669 Transcript_9664/m.13669 type:complete len:263 (-) Transcript_9664:1321-2109(-)